MGQELLRICQLLVVALQNFSFAVVTGALVCNLWLRAHSGRTGDQVERRLLWAARIASLTTVLSGALAFWMHAIRLSGRDAPDAASAAVALVQSTRYGQAWLVSSTFALAASMAILSGRGLSRNSTCFALGCIAGMALARSVVSRSVEAGMLSLPVLADFAHLLAVSCWVGMVFVAAFIVLPNRNYAEAIGLTSSLAFARWLSAAALTAFVVLMLAGTLNSIRLIDAPVELAATRFGNLLLLKLALVCTAVAMAAHNRGLVLPRLTTLLRQQDYGHMERVIRTFRRILQLESVVLISALIAAAGLVASPAP
jgi:copper resistance protein D